MIFNFFSYRFKIRRRRKGETANPSSSFDDCCYYYNWWCLKEEKEEEEEGEDKEVYYINCSMVSSQKDMFCSSPEVSPARIKSSLPSNLSYVYLWCILFDWDENVEEPFNIYQVALFSTRDLKPNWLKGDLDSEGRQKKLKFRAFPGKSFSLFAKIEKCKY